MAGLSFLDLMLAEALAGGLAREQQLREKPPPENVFVLPKNLSAWSQIKDACKKENMVFVVDVTDGSSENCKRVDSFFFDLAREFDGLPFFVIKVGPFGTFDQVRQDLGGIQYTPTILIGFYGDGLKRVKYEGEKEIIIGIRTGRLRDQVREFLNMRGRLMLTEKVAEGLAERVNKEMSERERKIRQEYEIKMKRELAEKEEKARKEEEEKKRLEEEEQKKKDEQRKRSAQIRRESRPHHLQELLDMDLDKVSIKELKNIMVKMGISHHDCFERADLKKKLRDNIPELRIALERKESESSRASVSSTDGYSSSSPGTPRNNLDSVFTDRVSELRTQLAAEQKANEVLRKENESLKRQLANSSTATRPPEPKPRTRLPDLSAVKELETKLLQTRMLYATALEDFENIRTIHIDPEGLVLSVKCNKVGIPNPDKHYAMKVLTDYFQKQTSTQVRANFQNEYQVLCQLPPHRSVIHMWAFFYDRFDPSIVPQATNTTRAMSLFILMDQHTMNMKEQVSALVDNGGLVPRTVIKWFTQLLDALAFLQEKLVVHRDLKLENLLLSADNNLILSDFGKAIIVDESFSIVYNYGGDKGGNTAHLSPEVINARPGPRKKIDYSKQPVWAAGVLAYELSGHSNPFEKGTIDQGGYRVDQVPALVDTYCKQSRNCKSLPASLTGLVRSMIQPEPRDRPTLKDCKFKATQINI